MHCTFVLFGVLPCFILLHIRQEVLRSVVFVGSFVGVFVIMFVRSLTCVGAEYLANGWITNRKWHVENRMVTSLKVNMASCRRFALCECVFSFLLLFYHIKANKDD